MTGSSNLKILKKFVLNIINIKKQHIFLNLNSYNNNELTLMTILNDLKILRNFVLTVTNINKQFVFFNLNSYNLFKKTLTFMTILRDLISFFSAARAIFRWWKKLTAVYSTRPMNMNTKQMIRYTSMALMSGIFGRDCRTLVLMVVMVRTVVIPVKK